MREGKSNAKPHRFASFLVTGKIAAMPLFFAQGSFAGMTTAQITADNLITQDLKIIEMPQSPVVELLALDNSYPNAQVVLPGNGCSYSSPTTMNLVLTGLKNGESTYVCMSQTKENSSFMSVYPAFRIGSDFKIVSSFQVSTTKDSSNTVSLNIDLNAFGNQYLLVNGSIFYLQVVTVDSNNQLRFSELDQVNVTQTDCNSYGGGTGY